MWHIGTKLRYRSAALVLSFSVDTVAIKFGTQKNQRDTHRLPHRRHELEVHERHGWGDSPSPYEQHGRDRADVPLRPPALRDARLELGVRRQIAQAHVAAGESITAIAPYNRTVDFISDSLSAGYTAPYESLSSFAYGVSEGLGNTEYNVIAYPSIYVAHEECFGNSRGYAHQRFHTMGALALLSIEASVKLIEGVHGKYPNAQVIVMYGNNYFRDQGYQKQFQDIVGYCNSDEYLSAPVIYNAATDTITTLSTPTQPFIDIDPQYHPTGVGHVKNASHLSQYIEVTFGWDLLSTGPKIFHGTL
ncbi:Lipase, GDSL-like protein [Xylariaceae sp. FL0255]|nr:Lipase, GDSL-like protein [Xylariaceae sp. FL0255]